MGELLIGADHGGFTLKKALVEHLRRKGIAVRDFGCHSEESCDYPDTAFKVASEVAKGHRGVLICGTGIGMSIAANKVRGVRAALCHDERTARLSREHNDANLLALGGRTTDVELAKRILDVWLSTSFAGERHGMRVGKITSYEAAQ